MQPKKVKDLMNILDGYLDNGYLYMSDGGNEKFISVKLNDFCKKVLDPEYVGPVQFSIIEGGACIIVPFERIK